MIKIVVSLLIFLTLFSINIFASDYPRQKAVISDAPVRSIAFSPDGNTIAGGGWHAIPVDGHWQYPVLLWDVASGKLKTTHTGHGGYIECVVFSPDGRTLVSSSRDNTIRLWDVESGVQKTLLTGHTDWIRSVAFSPDGNTLASGSVDNTIRLWNIASGKTKDVLTGHTSDVESVAFSPDGSTLASSGTTIRLWDLASGKQKAVLTGHNFNYRVDSVAFSPDGSTLANGGWGKMVGLWDVASGQQKMLLSGHADGAYRVVFSPDGNTFASGGFSGTVRLWDVASGQLKSVLTGHKYGLTFSPDGNTLANTAEGDRIILWNLTASETTPAVVRISPGSLQLPAIGEQLTVSLDLVGGENVVGYQATVVFDSNAFVYLSSDNGGYLPDGAFLATPTVGKSYVTLASTALAGGVNGDGALATITFKVIDVKTSAFILSQVSLVDPDGERYFPCVENSIVGEATVISPVHLLEDVNRDGVVNIQDLVLVSSNFGETGENKADVNGDGVVDIVDLVKVGGAIANAADDLP